jgi:hypothetical protein
MHDDTTMWRTGYMPLIIGGIGAMASALSLFMPWVTIASPVLGQIHRSGFDTREGKLFAAGLVILAVLARFEARTPRAATRTALLAGIVVFAVAGIVEYRDLSGLVGSINADFGAARLGFGLYAMGLGLTATTAGTLKRRLLMLEETVRAGRGEGLDQAA